MGLAAEPLAVTAAKTAVVAAVAIAAVEVLNSFSGVPTVGVILLGLNALARRSRMAAPVGGCRYGHNQPSCEMAS